MTVTNRDRQHLPYQAYLSFAQFDDYLAIVNVDGKEQFFDPGSRYCPYEHLAWKHTGAGGVRQTERRRCSCDISGGTLHQLTDPTHRRSHHGRARRRHAAPSSLTYIGTQLSTGVNSRSRGDATSLERDLRPQRRTARSPRDRGQGHLHRKTRGLRTTPRRQPRRQRDAWLFHRQAPPPPRRYLRSQLQAKLPPRKTRYPCLLFLPVHDSGCRPCQFPAALNIESLPATEKIPFQNFAVYNIKTESTPTSVTVQPRLLARRNPLHGQRVPGASHLLLQNGDQGSGERRPHHGSGAAKTTPTGN